jgi:hypothetical protein
MGELGALFNPGMRHEIEERESKQNRREEEGNARDGDLRIDLASGVAVINVPGKTAGLTPDEGDGESAAQGSRTVGEKPSAAASVRRTAHLRAEERKSASARNGRTEDRSAADRVDRTKSDRTKSGSGKSESPRPAPAPSSKASRASR